MSYIAPMIPENAPFDAAQRAWLNGFLAGLLSPGDGSGGASGAPGQIGDAAMAGRAADEPEDFPWHDPTLELEARLALAAGKPLERRLMAAMAQLDCGQCGYLCQTYAQAIARGAETSLTRGVPRGRATSPMLKELFAAPSRVAIAAAPAAPPAPAAADAPTHFVARLEAAMRLNRDGSA